MVRSIARHSQAKQGLQKDMQIYWNNVLLREALKKWREFDVKRNITKELGLYVCSCKRW